MKIPILEKAHYKRLKENNLVIECFYKRDKESKWNYIRSTDGLKSDDITNCFKTEKRYFLNNKLIYSDNKFNKDILYTFKDMDEEIISCPNCGHDSKANDFYDCCPYCRTIFNIDYETKSYGGVLDFYKDMLDVKWYKVLTIILAVIFASFAMINNIINEGFQIYFLIYLLFITPIYLLICYILTSMIMFIYFIFKMISVTKNYNVWKRLKEGKYKVNEKRFYNDLNIELANYYYTNKNNIIDFEILDYKKFRYYEKNNALYINVTILMKELSFKNNKIKSKKVKRNIILKMNEQEKIIDLENGYQIVECKSCGASCDLNDIECKFCGRINNVKNQWIIEKFY